MSLNILELDVMQAKMEESFWQIAIFYKNWAVNSWIAVA